MEKKTIELKSSEIEMIRSGINDSVNLLADDELSELFGELHCGNDYCPPHSPSENVSWMHIIEGRTAIATPLKPI